MEKLILEAVFLERFPYENCVCIREMSITIIGYDLSGRIIPQSALTTLHFHQKIVAGINLWACRLTDSCKARDNHARLHEIFATNASPQHESTMAVNGYNLENDTCSNSEEDEQLELKKVRRKLYAGCQDCSLNGSVELIPQFEDFGPRLIRIRMNDQIRELQTILRDP